MQFSKEKDKMETGLSSKNLIKGRVMRGGNRKKKELSSNGIKIEPFVPRRDHNPKELKTWAKRTGFVSDYSGEAGTSASENFDKVAVDYDHKEGGSSPKIEIDPVLGVARPNRDDEIELDSESKHGSRRSEKDRFLRPNYDLNRIIGNQNQKRKNGVEPVLDYGEKKVDLRGNGETNGSTENLIRDSSGHGLGVSAVSPLPEQKKEEEGVTEGEVKVNLYAEGEEPADRGWHIPSGMKYGLTENPGFVPLIYYGMQHYLSLIGSLVFIPLVMVPTMGGTDNDTANVISTMLFLSGATTILHLYFGTRLPLVQGGSFVYLAPALVIINSEEFRNLTHHKFRHIMRELQGAIIVGSIFQCILGFSGLMSILLR
ncbi:Nucleobase-ascorbate transporter 11, variant 3 [Lathyrus oleraceus]|nr:Nucleobase-ascorbate transporter 11, variant 3 [Pisum sativum]